MERKIGNKMMYINVIVMRLRNLFFIVLMFEGTFNDSIFDPEKEDILISLNELGIITDL